MATMKLYELTDDFTDLFDQFESISSWEPDTDEDGKPIDDNGNVIEDVDRYKEVILIAWFDTLQGIEELFEIKAENIAVYIKNLMAEVDVLKEEKKKLDKRVKQKNRQIESLTSYLMQSMKAISREKIDRPKAFIKIKTNPEGTVIENEKEFIEWAEKNGHDELLKYYAPEPKKLDIKKLIKSGAKLPFVHLERAQKLEIK